MYLSMRIWISGKNATIEKEYYAAKDAKKNIKRIDRERRDYFRYLYRKRMGIPEKLRPDDQYSSQLEQTVLWKPLKLSESPWI